MKTHLRRKILVAASALAAFLASPVAHAALVAHWSFDTATLTTSGGNVVGVADQTGLHNAVPGSGVGSATVAQGGPTFISNPIPSGNSAAGKFGEGLTLTGFNTAGGGGGQFLMFPEITELMASHGAPGYTVSMWAKTTITAFSRFTWLANWGDNATTPGRFVYGFGANAATQMGGQTRNSTGASGTDIYSQTPTTATLNDGNWHMLTWTFDPSTGVLISYFDGVQVGTFTSVAADKQMATSSSTQGTLGLKGDSGNFINGTVSFDEIWVFSDILDASTIGTLFSANTCPLCGGGGGGPTITGTNVWKGTVDGTTWDASVQNWATLGGAQTNYLQSSYAIFDDTAGNNTNINLATTITNGSILMSNTTAHYIWTGGGNIVGLGGMTKKNSGTLIVANSLANTFSGPIDLQAGTIQVGNGNTDVNAGNLGGGALTNNGVLLVNIGSGGTVTMANAISGSGTLTNLGAGTLTLSGASSFSSGVQVLAGTVRATSASALGAGTTFVNTNTTLVLGASAGNSITLASATMGVANGDATLATNAILQITGATNLLLSSDPQSATVSRNINVDSKLSGGGSIAIKNADNTTNPDGAGGVRFRNTNAVSDFTGNIIVTNNAKTELLVAGAGPFSPVNSAKFFVYCGAYNGGNTTFADGSVGYSEVNIRNNFTNDTVIGNDITLLGTGTPGNNAVVINSLGSSPNGAVATMGNLTIGDTQELIGYKGASSTTNTVKFSSVTLTGGTAIFSPKSSAFGATSNAGTSFVLNNVSGPAGAGITMNGQGTLALTGTSTYSGPTTVQQGLLLINGFNSGGGVTNAGGSFLGGNGTNSGPVQVDGTLAPGSLGSAGTFGAGGLKQNGGVLFDIGTNNTVGGGVNDLIEVAGNLDLSGGSATVTVNPLTLTPQSGTYRLIDYTGSRTGTFAGDPPTVGRVHFQLDYSTANQVNMGVTGGPALARWVSTGDPTWDNGGVVNWSTNSGTSPNTQFQIGDTVVFDDLVSAPQTNLTLNVAVIPTWFTNNSSVNSYAITGLGKVSGAGGLVKLGNSTLTMGTTNDFTGNVSIGGGTLKVANFQALGAGTSAVVINNGGSLDLGGIPTANVAGGFGTRSFLVAGGGVNNNGAIINSVNTNQQNAFQSITLTANATFGGLGRWDMRGGTPGPVLDLAGFKLTKTGSNQISLVSTRITAGDIDINQGVLSMEQASVVTNGGTITVNAGGVLGHFRLFAGALTRPIVLNGGTITNQAGNGSTNDSPISITADSVLSANAGPGTDLYLRGPISGSFGFTKIGTNNLILSGTNTYTGKTVISNGTVVLLDSTTPLTNSPLIVIASGAILDLNQRTNSIPARTLTLINGQTLINSTGIVNGVQVIVNSGATFNQSGTVNASVTVNSGGVMTGNGTVTSNVNINAGGFLLPGGTNGIGRITANLSPSLSGRTIIEIDKGNLATNDQVFAGGPVVYGGTLTVTNIGPALASGDVFKVFNGSSYPTFFTLDLPNPGVNLLWVTNKLNVDGTLSVTSNVVAPTTNATITKVTLVGTNVVVHGTNNNVPNSGFHYVVLTTPNLTNALSNWTPVITNPFNPDGTFDYTNPIVPGMPQQFIDVKAVP